MIVQRHYMTYGVGGSTSAGFSAIDNAISVM